MLYYERHTFTHPLLCAHLGAVFHGMQGEVDLGHLPLVLHGANSIVDVSTLVDRLAVHLGGVCFLLLYICSDPIRL